MRKNKGDRDNAVDLQHYASNSELEDGDEDKLDDRDLRNGHAFTINRSYSYSEFKPLTDNSRIDIFQRRHRIIPSFPEEKPLQKAVDITAYFFGSTSPLYALSRYFSAREAADWFYHFITRTEHDGKTTWLGQWAGSGAEVANSYLAIIGCYRFSIGYAANKIRRDTLILIGAFTTALSDTFSALTAKTPWEVASAWYAKVFTWFCFFGNLLSAFALNISSTLQLYNRLSASAEDLLVYMQCLSLSYRVSGRNNKQALLFLKPLIKNIPEYDEPLHIRYVLSSIKQKCTMRDDFIDDATEEVEAWFSQLDSSRKKLYLTAVTKKLDLWNAESYLSRALTLVDKPFIVVAIVALFYGPYDLVQKLVSWTGCENEIVQDVSYGVGVALGLAPPPIKAAVYIFLWQTGLFRIAHISDILRNTLYLVQKNPRVFITSALFTITVLAITGIFSGAGFALTEKAFWDFFWVVCIKNIIGLISGNSSIEAPQAIKYIRTTLEIMGGINGSAINAFAVASGEATRAEIVEKKSAPTENRLARFFAAEADKLMPVPAQTFTQNVVNSIWSAPSKLRSCFFGSAREGETLPLLQSREAFHPT